MIADAGKAAAVLFVAVIVQVSILSNVDILHGRPKLILVTVVAVALLRGAVFGAVAGFGAGFLADTGTFGMLGFTSLLLTLAGYWHVPFDNSGWYNSSERAARIFGDPA